jgi:hypothetical protein
MRKRNQVSEADMGWAQAGGCWIVRILGRRYAVVRGVGGVVVVGGWWLVVGGGRWSAVEGAGR